MNFPLRRAAESEADLVARLRFAPRGQHLSQRTGSNRTRRTATQAGCHDSHILSHIWGTLLSCQRLNRDFLISHCFFHQQIIMSKEVQSVGARGGLFGAGGRFKGGNDPIMEKFNESINFDKRLVN
jgi:hypothetical protein